MVVDHFFELNFHSRSGACLHYFHNRTIFLLKKRRIRGKNDHGERIAEVYEEIKWVNRERSSTVEIQKFFKEVSAF